MRIPGPDKSVFYLDPSAGLDSGNRWVDSSPYQLNVAPQAGFAAPNYGLVLGPSGAPCIRFTGAVNCYGLMSGDAQARFYAVAPTTQMTFALVARHVTPALWARWFTTLDAGMTRGVGLLSGTAIERLYIQTHDAAGVAGSVVDTNDVPVTGRTLISAQAYNKTIALGRSWHDGTGRAATITGGANPAAYDVTVVPAVGATLVGASRITADIYFLGFWPYVWTKAEYDAFCLHWQDRT